MRTLLIVVGALVPTALLAQVDVTLQLGYGSGVLDVDTGIVCAQDPCASFAEGDDSPLLGAIVDIPLRGNLAFELRAARQESELRFVDPRVLPATDQHDLTVSQLQVGLRRHFDVGQWQPFGAAGVGVVRLRSDPTPVLLAREDRFAATFAGGAMRSLNDRWGVRLEARANYFALPETLGGDTVNLEATGGVGLRF